MRKRRTILLAVVVALAAFAPFATASEMGVFNVRDYGATGDGWRLPPGAERSVSLEDVKVVRFPDPELPR